MTRNPEATKGYTYIKTIKTTSRPGSWAYDSRENAMNKARNEAALIGGDLLFITDQTGNNIADSATVTAEVYRQDKP